MSQNINSGALSGSIPLINQEINTLDASNMMQNLNGPIPNGCQSKAPSLINQGQQTSHNGSKNTHFTADQNNGCDINRQQGDQIQSKVGSIIGNGEMVTVQSKNLQILSKKSAMMNANCENMAPMSKLSAQSQHLNTVVN